MDKLDSKQKMAYMLLGNYIRWMNQFKKAPGMVEIIYSNFQGAIAMAASTELISNDHYHRYLEASISLMNLYCGGKK